MSYEDIYEDPLEPYDSGVCRNTYLHTYGEDTCDKFLSLQVSSFEAYMLDVRSQLKCNISEEEYYLYGAYDYTNEQIDENLEYFRECYNQPLSAYKALLFLNAHLYPENYE